MLMSMCRMRYITMHNIDVCMCTHQVFILKDVHVSFTGSDFRPWCL